MLVEFGHLPAPMVARIVQLALAAGLAATLIAGSAPGSSAAQPDATGAWPVERLASPVGAVTVAIGQWPGKPAAPVVVRTSTLDPRALVPAEFADWERDER